MTNPELVAGSFRDPSGQVYIRDGRILRSVRPYAKEHFELARSSGLLDNLVGAGQLLPFEIVDPSILRELEPEAIKVLEHPPLTYVSYPYEWPFPALKAAALLHLDIQLKALDHGICLSDASAYNIQFRGPNPVFIDHLSFRRYRDGDYWLGHGQFCQEFLCPLLLRTICGVAHNDWYRGSLNGVAVTDLARILPLKGKFSWNVFVHVVLQARYQKVAVRRQAARDIKKKKLPRESLKRMLQSMRNWVSTLQPARTGETAWQDYSNQHGYSEDELKAKKAFVHAYVTAQQPAVIWDIGCNTGSFSQVALDAGARTAIGFDMNQGSLEAAYARAEKNALNLLPLYLDASNPSPAQGWGETERMGLGDRVAADGLLALAVVHHLAITHNVPLDRVVTWLIGMAPSGVIEFVPKDDPMVKELLRLREDIFPDFTAERFLRLVEDHARIERREQVSQSGRLLVMYRRD